MNRRIYLIRHGNIDTGNEKKYIGITDLCLDPDGIAQAEFLKNYFKDIHIDRVFTSPLKRCLQTTEIIWEERKPDYTVVKEFTEINMGLWENKPMKYMKENFPLEYELRGRNLEFFIPPEGESFHQLADRVLKSFRCIVKEQTGDIMIVAHAGVNRVIISQLLGLPIPDIFSIHQPYGCVYELTLQNESEKWLCRQLV